MPSTDVRVVVWCSAPTVDVHATPSRPVIAVTSPPALYGDRSAERGGARPISWQQR
jgi:hypothetical protein